MYFMVRANYCSIVMPMPPKCHCIYYVLIYYQLNRWGFSRVSRGPEMGAYYHKVSWIGMGSSVGTGLYAKVFLT